MASLLKEAMALQGRFQYFSISYIDRGRNQVANDLANAGRKGGKSRQGTEEAVASIVKLVLWHTTISQLDGELRDEYKWIIPSLWQEFLMFEKMVEE